MPKLDSEKTRRQLTSKLGCKEDHGRDHIWFTLYDQDGTVLSRTRISHRPRHDISGILVSKMSKQLKLGNSANLTGLIDCSKTRDECLQIIRSASYYTERLE
jgi:hypothetical protein